MNHVFSSVLIISLLFLWACETRLPDTKDPSKNPVYRPGTVTAFGKPIGPATTKTIGPEGGSLTTNDGKLTLTIPSGALSKSTPFSVEPIENTAMVGVGTSYRITPEEIKFNKPATFAYHSTGEDLNGAAGALGLAQQQAEGSWAITRKAELDNTTGRISAKLTKTGRTSIVSKYFLYCTKDTLIPSEETTLELRHIDESFKPTSPEEELFVPLGILSTVSEISAWTVNGKSTLDAQTGLIKLKPENANNARFYYVAPNKLPAKEKRQMAVGIKLIKEAGAQLVRNIKIRSAGVLIVDGKRYEDIDIDISHQIHENGTSYFVKISEQSRSAKIVDFQAGLLGWFTGPKSYTLKGDHRELQKSTFFIGGPARDGGASYSTMYFEETHAELDKVVFDPAELNVERFTATNEISSGTVVCNLYREGKKTTPVKVRASFSAIANAR
ncbi:hypothetical protein LZD49_27290 [Dyadobacter sp. CY261]|uniref:hypothetical protein n=1 Tax=Dyadobacter sp. CY261 TaxID=2907203 RepID=UPI001F2452CC|nr:hypothetical protein [Dyadobacter sp. CY261]MCF0074219.1 hypothetical protein [Dyadobacter sp. CY261]